MTETLTTSASPVEHGNAIAAMNERRFKIPGDVVNRATAELPDDQRSAIRWLHAHAAENDISLKELGELVRYDETTLYRVFRGQYEGKLGNIVKEIESFRRLEEQRSKIKGTGFVETSLSKRIWMICDAALEFQRIAFIFGDSQIGKTTSLRRYRDQHNHGSTIYVSMPTGGAIGHFLEALATALRMSAQQKESELRRRVRQAFDGRMILIVDEAHQALRAQHVNSLEFVREIHDATRCGVVLSGTNVFRDEIDTGKLAPVMRQTVRRRIAPLQLPDRPPIKDLNAFAAAYGLPPASGDSFRLQTDVIRDDALGMWLTLLRFASKVAAKEDAKMNWGHVHKARAALDALSGEESWKERKR